MKNNPAHLSKYVIVNNTPHKWVNGKLIPLNKK